MTQNVWRPRGEFRHPWQNLVDLRVTKSFRMGATRFEPTVDVFNIFNNNAVTSANTTIDRRSGRPSEDRDGAASSLGGRHHVLERVAHIA